MSTVFLDPVQMDATAGHVGEHVQEVTALAADLETACSAVVPASLAAWLAEELRDIAVTVRMIALLYAVAALDTAQRAQQIQADQSLAAAAPTFTEAPLVGGFMLGTASLASTTGASSLESGLFLGAKATSGGVSFAGLSTEAFAAQNVPWGTGSLSSSGGSNWGWNSNLANIVAPTGLSAVAPGIYDDEFGRRGGLAATYRDPRTGDLRF